MIDIDWRPDTKSLRQFGWIALAGFGVAGALIAWRAGVFSGSGRWAVPAALWGLALICPLLASLRPELLRFVYLPMMVLAFPIGFVLGTIMLLLVFFLVFTPLALWFKLVGRDELKRSPDPGADSFWMASASEREPESYYRQY